MFHWEKLGRVFEPAAIPSRPGWMHEYAQAPCALVLEDRVRIYFSCRPPREPDGQVVSHTAFVELDRGLQRVVGLADRPILELGGLGCFDQFGIYPTSVIEDGDEVLAYYAGHTRCESVPFDTAIGLAVSRDGGITFTREGPGPVLARSLREPFVLSGPKIRRFGGAYQLFYITGTRWFEHQGRMEVVYRIRMATSTDGRAWQRTERDLLPERLGAFEVQSSPDVFFANGRYHMFFGYMRTPEFRQDPRKGYRIGYAVSDDLVRWERLDERAGIGPSAAGFDDQTVSYPHLFALDGATYMLYLGNEVGRFGFGLARLEGELR